MRKIVLAGAWQEPVEFQVTGSLEETLIKAEEQMRKEYRTGYFYKVKETDEAYLKASGTPIIVSTKGERMAPIGLHVIE